MSQKIPKKIREAVAKRSNFSCEYCLLKETDSFLPFQIDHIISIKHGGGDEYSNLAYSCPHCNQHKGSDLVTILDSYQDIVSLFNPRIHPWNDHFYIDKGGIFQKTRIGEATIKLLQFNAPDRLIIRQILMEEGSYP